MTWGKGYSGMQTRCEGLRCGGGRGVWGSLVGVGWPGRGGVAWSGWGGLVGVGWPGRGGVWPGAAHVMHVDIRPALSLPADPLLQNLSVLLFEGHSQDPSIGGAVDLLQLLVAGGTLSIRYEPGDHQYLGHDLQALLVDPCTHLLLQRSDLVQYVHNLHLSQAKFSKSTSPQVGEQ